MIPLRTLEAYAMRFIRLLTLKRQPRSFFSAFGEMLKSDQMDDTYASFWYALADWQWKHGVLSEDVKAKALGLLDSHAGLSDWMESGSDSDVKKRLSVMDELQKRLESPMPAVCLPKKRLLKPKHKKGDILIFKTCAKKERENTWSIKYLGPAFMFRDAAISHARDELTPPFDAHEKYMAILCTETRKEAYSKYLPGLYNENSVYAFYDYLSDQEPNLGDLQERGFLPFVCWDLKDFNKKITNYIGWTYQFELVATSFSPSRNPTITHLKKINSCSEADRFIHRVKQKDYLDEALAFFELDDAFSSCWKKKKRMEEAGIKIDTLMDPSVANPAFLPIREIDKAYWVWANQ